MAGHNLRTRDITGSSATSEPYPILSPVWSAAESVVDVFGIEEYKTYIRMVEDT